MRGSCLALAVCALGCDAGIAVGPDAAPPRVELGTGTTGFRPLANGDTIELVRGPQAGWHLFVAAKVWNMEPEGLLLTYRDTEPGKTELINSPAQYRLTAARVLQKDECFVRLGDRTVLNIEKPDTVVGKTLTIEVTAGDPAGLHATDSRMVHVVDEE